MSAAASELGARSSSALLDLLVEAEQRFPVERWRVGGVHVWPLVRYDVATRNYYMVRRAGGTGSARSAVRGRLDALRRSTSAWREARRTDRNDAKLTTANLLLYSDGVSFARIGDTWTEKFCDPVADAGRRRGLRTLMLTPGPPTTYFVPRRTPSVLIQPAIDAIGTACALAVRASARFPIVELDGYEDALSFLRREWPGLAVCEREQLRRTTVHVKAFAALYTAILRRVRPRAVFLVCYYGAERMAMVLAARRLGIPAVDLQHGVAGDAHWAYARWTRLPAGGYELLPRFFFCWDQTDAETVERWARASGGAHRALVTGNPYLSEWLQGEAAFVRESDQRLGAMTREAGGRAHVLYTANGYETDDQIRTFAALVHETRDELFWWIRMHPCRPATGSAFESALRGTAPPTWNVRDATELPLYALLRVMDAHVTEASSTVVEAAEFGVPSVLLNESEASLFPEQVDSGWVLPVDGLPELRAGLARQRERRAALRAAQARAPRADLDAALSVVLGQATA